MKANPLKFSIICLKVIFFTAKISLITLYKSYRHTFTRENGNQLMQYWSDKMLKLVNLHLIIHPNNEPLNTENRACIYMSNHLSLFDIPVLYKAIPGTLRMVAKKELFNTPIWGQGMKAGEFIMLDRQNSKQSITALKLARKKMQSGIKIWISPEGTRSVSGELLNFKKGGFLLALQTNAIIIPVGIRGTDQVMQAKSLDIYLNQQVEVSLGNAIDTNGYSVKEIRQLMSDVKQQIYNSISSSKSSSDNSSSDNSSGGLPS